MTFDEFVNTYLGKKVDFDGVYGGQCVDLYRQYVKDVIGGLQSAPVIGAYDIWETYNKDTFTRIDNTPTGVPQKGDVVIWNKNVGGGFGHVAIFIEGNANSFTSLDQNWPTLSVVTKTNHNYTNVLGWLHPKENMTTDEMIIKKADFEKLVTKSSALDDILAKYNVADAQSLYNMVAGLQARQTDLTNQLGTAQAEVNNKLEIIKHKDEEIANFSLDNKTLMERLEQCAENCTQLGKDKGNLAIQVEQLKVQLETCKQGGITQTSTIEQLISWFKNLWNKN